MLLIGIFLFLLLAVVLAVIVLPERHIIGKESRITSLLYSDREAEVAFLAQACLGVAQHVAVVGGNELLQ